MLNNKSTSKDVKKAGLKNAKFQKINSVKKIS